MFSLGAISGKNFLSTHSLFFKFSVKWQLGEIIYRVASTLLAKNGCLTTYSFFVSLNYRS